MKKFKVLSISAVAVFAASLFSWLSFAPRNIANTHAADAATATTCNFATTAGAGQYLDSLCFIDWTNFDAAQATSANGQNFSVPLGGGVTLTFNLKAVVDFGAPTFSATTGYSLGAFGNTAYLDVAGKPSLYSLATMVSSTDPAPSGQYTTAPQQISHFDISNIQLRSTTGVLKGYRFFIADTESTNGLEKWEVSSNKPIDLLETIPAAAHENGEHDACDAILGGLGTNSVVCQSTVAVTADGSVGAAIFSVDNATDLRVALTEAIRQYDNGGWRTMNNGQGFGFGVKVDNLQVVAPPTAAPKETTVNYDETANFTPDVHGEGPFTGEITTAPESGTAQINTDGTVSFTPPADAINGGDYHFTITWTDDMGQTVAQNYTVHVLPKICEYNAEILASDAKCVAADNSTKPVIPENPAQTVPGAPDTGIKL
jgi:hypothetical protein